MPIRNIAGRRAALGLGEARPAWAPATAGAPPAGFVVRSAAGGVTAEVVGEAEADGAVPPRTPAGIVVLRPHVFARQVRHRGRPRLSQGGRNA